MVEPSVPELAPEGQRSPVADMFGGRQGVIDSVVPVTVFVAVNAARKDVKEAAVAAVASSLVLVVLRLLRKEPLKHVFSGVLGVAISALIAVRMGRSEGFFLPGIALNAIYFVVFLGSVLVGRPVVGFLIRQISDKPASWHDLPRVRRAYAEATLGWAALFATRVLVVGYFTLQGRTVSAGVSKIFLGPVLYVAALAATMPYIAARTRGADAEPAADVAAADVDRAPEPAAGGAATSEQPDR